VMTNLVVVDETFIDCINLDLELIPKATPSNQNPRHHGCASVHIVRSHHSRFSALTFA
jgi:hypothetical protein